MSKMIETKDHKTDEDRRSFIRSSDIVSVRRHGSYDCKVTTKHGRTYVINKTVEEMQFELEFHGEAIAAHPGYYVLYTENDSHNMSDFKKIPVVGWMKFRRIYEKYHHWGYFLSVPIVAPANSAPWFRNTDIHEKAIVLPDGRTIDTSYLREYESAEKFVEEHDLGGIFSSSMKTDSEPG